MSNYVNFSSVYDSLIKEDIDYNKWVMYIKKIFTHYGKTPKIICDLACGTGNFTVPMSELGYDMIGIDKSVSMLNIAKEKAEKKGQDIVFLNQSFSRLDLYGGCDAFLCMIDGFNYVLSPKSLYQTAKRIKTCFLEPGGIVIFDLSTPYKLKNYLGNNTFIYDKDDIFYTCENKFYDKFNISHMDLTFFVKSGEQYRRFSEHHLMRAYEIDEIKKFFRFAGFETVDVFSPFTFDLPKNDEMRYVFIAR